MDFNKTKPSSRRHIIKTTLSSEAGQEFLKTPVYALGGGTLVYMMNSEEAASKGGNLRLVKSLMLAFVMVMCLLE